MISTKNTDTHQAKLGHILIVEDEADVREALCAQLELEGYEVFEARSAPFRASGRRSAGSPGPSP